MVAIVPDDRKPGCSRYCQASYGDDWSDLPVWYCAWITRRNPATEVRPSDILKASRKENYARVDARDLPALLRQIEIYQGTHITRLAMKLMALTFVRTCELIGAKWSEFI